MKTLAQFLPLTHAVAISRAAFSGKYLALDPAQLGVSSSVSGRSPS